MARFTSKPAASWVSVAPVVAFALVAANATAAPAPQQQLWSLHGEVRNERFGQSVAWLDDLDGDGVRDFAAGASAWEAPFVPRHGIVRLCSGRDGVLLRELRNDDRFSFGWTVANGGDLDGDGHDDVLIGAPYDGSGFAFAYGSVSGTPLWELTGSATTSVLARFGDGLVSLGDLDGDGVPDFALGAPDHIVGTQRAGKIELRSGATGALLRSRTAPVQANFGDHHQIDATGDFDGDGFGDLLALEMLPVPAGSPNCNLDVWSGASFASLLHVVLTLPKSVSAQTHHPTARVSGDVDGDGVVDFVVSMDSRAAGPSARALLVSGATGATIRTLLGATATFGERCGAVGDLDGDGLAEVAITKDSLDLGLGDLEIYKGSDGSLLRTILSDHQFSHAFAWSFDASVDADGDGSRDLLVGSPPYLNFPKGYSGGPGRVQRRSLVDGSTLFARDGVNVERYVVGPAVVVDDVDGDGLLDVVTPIGEALNSMQYNQRLSLRSGADGHELALTPPPPDNFHGSLLAIPDVDGDGLVDVVVVSSDPAAGRVDVRSGAWLHLIKSLALSPGIDPAYALASVVQPATGHVEVCAGSPSGNGGAGHATLFDVVTGAVRWETTGDLSYPEALGWNVAVMGDLDGDGWSDWAVGAPNNRKNGAYAGAVHILSGMDGTILHSLFGPTRDDQMGVLMAALPDSGGDGVSELLVKSVRQNSGAKGQLDLLDSASWTPIWTKQGTVNSENYPHAIFAPLPDLDGDGFADFSVGAHSWTAFATYYELRSGRDGRLIHHRLFEAGEYKNGWRAAGPPPGQTGVRRRGGGPVVVAVDSGYGGYGAYSGRIELLEFDDLYMEIEPPSAPAGATVDAFVRGGPGGALAAVMLESINGIPVGVMLAVSVLDANGELALDAVIPPGLSGDEWSLLGFAIGWNGKLVVSQSTDFSFE